MRSTPESIKSQSADRSKHREPIGRGTTLGLGLAQLVSWGTSYYLIGGFGDAIAASLGWSRDLVYGGFAVALLVMGLTSPLVGRLIDRHGGRRVMIGGALLNAGCCIMLGVCHSVGLYYAVWTCLGLAMRLCLYDAAFATLARIGGPAARRPMSQITLLGGLASTTFWPLGQALADHVGWRGAMFAYAGFAVATVPIYAAVPDARYIDPGTTVAGERRSALVTERRDLAVAGALYALIVTLANFLNAGMSAHMIGILAGLGLAAGSVWIASLRGVGQSVARLGEIAFGRRVDPFTLNLVACLLLPVAFIAGLFGGQSGVAAMGFALLYGAGNGLLTITRGTLPLVMFDHRTYGSFVGRLIAPSYIISAAAPVVYAVVIQRFGQAAALGLSIVVAVVASAAAALLLAKYGGDRRPSPSSGMSR